jgi:hypothetical protein
MENGSLDAVENFTLVGAFELPRARSGHSLGDLRRPGCFDMFLDVPETLQQVGGHACALVLGQRESFHQQIARITAHKKNVARAVAPGDHRGIWRTRPGILTDLRQDGGKS